MNKKLKCLKNVVIVSTNWARTSTRGYNDVPSCVFYNFCNIFVHFCSFFYFWKKKGYQPTRNTARNTGKEIIQFPMPQTASFLRKEYDQIFRCDLASRSTAPLNNKWDKKNGRAYSLLFFNYIHHLESIHIKI